MRFGEVTEPWWDDSPLFIIGGGPSLRGRPLDRLRARGRVLGINRVPLDTPCDACFTLDRSLIEKWSGTLDAMACAGLEVFAAVGDDYDGPVAPRVRYLKRLRDESVGLSRDPGSIINGLNSGYGAINLATLKRAQSIYLLGFDLRVPSGEAPRHWHDGYPWHSRSAEIYFERWAKGFERIARDLPPGVRVWNANPDSAVRCFPFTTYEELGL